ncbi:meiotic recombination protein REC114-like [Watersipora subatra]|uniref:meiotic recombination protein REC114-like n=1 Tax=Watersipora subatra TaxID=2589382 RepID=UPI00355B50D7
MDIVHDWELERYGKFDTQVQNGWSTIENKGHSVKILASRKFLISSESTVLESFSLFNPTTWLKCYQKGDSLLLLHRVKDLSRKFRLKFKATVRKSSLEICDEVAQVLRQYLTVAKLDAHCQQSQPMELEPTQCLTGQVSQDVFAQAVLGKKYSLPSAYAACNYPTEGLETLVRLCIIDPNFPSFVAEVEKIMESVTANK